MQFPNLKNTILGVLIFITGFLIGKVYNIWPNFNIGNDIDASKLGAIIATIFVGGYLTHVIKNKDSFADSKKQLLLNITLDLDSRINELTSRLGASEITLQKINQGYKSIGVKIVNLKSLSSELGVTLDTSTLLREFRIAHVAATNRPVEVEAAQELDYVPDIVIDNNIVVYSEDLLDELCDEHDNLKLEIVKLRVAIISWK